VIGWWIRWLRNRHFRITPPTPAEPSLPGLARTSSVLAEIVVVGDDHCWGDVVLPRLYLGERARHRFTVVRHNLRERHRSQRRSMLRFGLRLDGGLSLVARIMRGKAWFDDESPDHAARDEEGNKSDKSQDNNNRVDHAFLRVRVTT